MQEKHLFARKCYTWRSRAKQPNGRRKMILSLFPGDPLSPGIRECWWCWKCFFLMPRKFQSTTFTQMEILEQFDIFVSSLCAKLINACTDYLQMDLAFLFTGSNLSLFWTKIDLCGSSFQILIALSPMFIWKLETNCTICFDVVLMLLGTNKFGPLILQLDISFRSVAVRIWDFHKWKTNILQQCKWWLYFCDLLQ